MNHLSMLLDLQDMVKKKIPSPNPAPTGAFTVDLEAWFHAARLAVPENQWASLPLRLEKPLDQILELLDRHNTKATFFVLGWLASKEPTLIRRVHDLGHEVACHGYWHRPITTQTRDAFHDDVCLAKACLQEVTGSEVVGYRAPRYSITNKTLWAIDELRSLGFQYDSSIYPVRSPHGAYGIPGTPRNPYAIQPNFWEFPLPTWNVLGKRVPVATGAYLRLMPWSMTRAAIRQNQRRAIPVVVNVHPWELDPGQPRWLISYRSRLIHYANHDTTLNKLDRILSLGTFTTLRTLRKNLVETGGILVTRQAPIHRPRALPTTPQTNETGSTSTVSPSALTFSAPSARS